MKMLTKFCLPLFLLLFSLHASALVVTFHYDKFATKLFARVTEDIKQECCDSEGKTYGYKTIDVIASGEGNMKCATTATIKARMPVAPEEGEIELISYLQKYAEEQINNGKLIGNRKDFFTVTNDGVDASKAYKVSWIVLKDGSATITITDQIE